MLTISPRRVSCSSYSVVVLVAVVMGSVVGSGACPTGAASWSSCGDVKLAMGFHGAAVLQRRWWFSMLTRNRHSGQTRFPFCQSAQALHGFRCWLQITSTNSNGWAWGQLQGWWLHRRRSFPRCG